MEKILIGLLLSDKPLALKKGLGLQISNAATRQSSNNKDAYNNMMDEGICHLFNKSSFVDTDSKEILIHVLTTWISCNVELSNQYIKEQIISKQKNDAPKEEKINQIQKLLFFIDALVKPKQKLPLCNIEEIQKYFYDVLTNISGLEELNLVCKCYLKYSFLMPKDLSTEAVQSVVGIFVKVLSETPISDLIKYETEKADNDRFVFKLLKWLNEKDPSFSKIIANQVFNVLTKEGPHPSVSVATLLQYLNLEGLSVDIGNFIKTRVLSDDLLTLMTSRLIDWICLPDPKIPVEQWALKVLKFLIQQQKFQILFLLVEGKIKQMFHLLFLPVFRTRALALATFMLISYLHSPKPFHQISSMIPNLINQLKAEESKNGEQILKVIPELTYTLMYHYPGFPDIYEKLLTSLQGFSMPSEENMKAWLKSSVKISQIDIPEFIVPEREPDAKAGLDNLGNTCYANSVIQALFNMKSVKKLLLEKPLTKGQIQPTTKSLQELFVLLSLSKRSSIAPRAFLNFSRPSWFQAGFQQDCSEYLKYLLDKLQTESIDHIEDINSFVSGKLRTSVVCMTCGFVSVRDEVFNDIPLSFHHDHSPVHVEQTLKGGDSSDCLKRKLDSKMVKSSSDGKQSVMDDDENILTSQPLDILPNDAIRYNIKGMLFNYLTPEVLKDSNKYFCESCSALQNATKTINIIEYPQYLVLTMKRFTYNVTTQKRSKLLHMVVHPHTFTVCSACSRCHEDVIDIPMDDEPGSSSHTVDAKSACCTPTNSNHFRLLSVIVHSGHSSDSGHYYAYTCDYDDSGTKWRLMNDSRVSNAPVDCISKLSSRFPLDTPYVCIYEKFDPDRETDGSDSIEIQKSLIDYLNADNAQYEQELQRDAFRRKRNYFTSPHEDDDSGGSGGACGPGNDGSGDGLHAAGRFVF